MTLGTRLIIFAACALVILAGASECAGAPPPPPAGRIDTVQELADRSAEWIGAQLRVPPRYFEVERSPSLTTAAAQIMSTRPNVIELRPLYYDSLQASFDSRYFPPTSAAVLLHELLHKMEGWGGTDHDLLVEEGVVEAVKQDMMPAYTRRFFGRAVMVTTKYGGIVRAIRGASKIAARCDGWRCRDARLWRRALLLADTPGRRSMIACAEATKAWASA